MLTAGQRYDIIVEANATAGNYQMRASWQNTCATNYNWDSGLAIIWYDNYSTEGPISVSIGFTETCTNEDISNLTPYVPITVDAPSSFSEVSVNYSWPGLFYWTINDSSLYLNWSNPTTLMEYKNEDVFPTPYNVYPLTTVNEWVYWVIVDSTVSFVLLLSKLRLFTEVEANFET